MTEHTPSGRSIDEVTAEIIDAALQIHRELGPGLIESVYEAILTRRLMERGLHVERQKVVDFVYDGVRYQEGFRLDQLVEHTVIVELKAVDRIIRLYGMKVLSHLKLMDLRVGLVLNFGGATLKEGIQRVVNSRSVTSPRVLVPMRHAPRWVRTTRDTP